MSKVTLVEVTLPELFVGEVVFAEEFTVDGECQL
jgi:hypothetical protein